MHHTHVLANSNMHSIHTQLICKLQDTHTRTHTYTHIHTRTHAGAQRNMLMTQHTYLLCAYKIPRHVLGTCLLSQHMRTRSPQCGHVYDCRRERQRAHACLSPCIYICPHACHARLLHITNVMHALAHLHTCLLACKTHLPTYTSHMIHISLSLSVPLSLSPALSLSLSPNKQTPPSTHTCAPRPRRLTPSHPIPHLGSPSNPSTLSTRIHTTPPLLNLCTPSLTNTSTKP
jgi:hypothetical protein